jgi:hypothetical protein
MALIQAGQAKRLFGGLFLFLQQPNEMGHAGIVLAPRRRRRLFFPAKSLDQSENHGQSA